MNKEKGSTKDVIICIFFALVVVVMASILLRILENFLIKKIEAKTLDYAAMRVAQSYPGIINLKAEKSFTFSVSFKNIGLKNWAKTSVALKTEDNKPSSFAHSSWKNNITPYVVKSGVAPKNTGILKFALKAPTINGTYWQKFQLYNGNYKILGGEIEIGMKVYGGKEPEKTPTNPNPEPEKKEEIVTPVQNNYYWDIFSSLYEIKQTTNLATEPKIRVGLFYETNELPYQYLPIKIKSNDQESYQLKILNENSILLTQTLGEETTIDFDFTTQKYIIKSGDKILASTNSPLKFISSDPTKQLIFKITSWYRGPFWGMECNDNEYRGEIELKYNQRTGRLWLINELPIEDYMKGVAEVKDSYPIEALKAQKIAARTYAYTRILLPKYTNVNDEDLPLFDLRSTQADQVYRGYLWEKRSPNIEKAAQETSGMVAVYQETPILAYYFARTDGKTRSGCAVGMTKDCLPYLIAVDDPPGKGKTKLGHGVGLPQQSMRVAADQGALFHQILRYYYRGIEIKKFW